MRVVQPSPDVKIKEFCACINILKSIYLSSSNSFILLPTKKREKKYNEIQNWNKKNYLTVKNMKKLSLEKQISAAFAMTLNINHYTTFDLPGKSLQDYFQF